MLRQYGIHYGVGIVAEKTNILLLTNLGVYAERLGAENPPTIEDCFYMIGDLTRDEGPSNAANLLTRKLQAACRTVEDSVAQVVRVEVMNEQALSDARLDAKGYLGDYKAGCWHHHMGQDWEINNLQDLRGAIVLLAESFRWESICSRSMYMRVPERLKMLQDLNN